jgi:hypothetical protein
MLDDMMEVEEDVMPPLTDPRVQEYANELGLEWETFDKPRALLQQEIWPAGDRAYMAIRDELPFIASMKFIDNSMLGDPGIRNAIKGQRDELLNTCIPADGSWLEAASMNKDDNDGTLAKVKNMLIAKFIDADIRDTSQIAFDQLLARGVTSIGLRWETLYSIHRAPRSMVKGLRDIAEQLELTNEDGEPLLNKGPAKYWKKIFDGPLTYPIDMHRLWLDPTSDIGGKDREPSFIHLSLKTMSDLKNAKDRETGEHLYDQEVLKDVQEWTYMQFYKMNPYACQSTKLMGIDPSLEDLGKFVPVYMFYRQVRSFKDESVFVDKYFYVARSGSGKEWKIIRVQDNPSIRGVRPFYVLNNDPYLGSPYGVSMAEKALSAWKAKNIIDAVDLNGVVLERLPPYYYFGNVLKDDRKPRWMPAAGQEIVNRPGIGKDWLFPFPINPQNFEIGMQASRFRGEAIQAATGYQSAAINSDPTRSMSSRKTATEVRATNSEGATSGSVLSGRVNEKLMEPLANAMHDLCREHATEDQRYVTLGVEGKPKTETMTPQELDRDRSVKVVGRRAIADKANVVASLTEVLKILSMPQAAQCLNSIPAIIQDTLLHIISTLGVPVKDEYRMSPDQLMAADPKVQMASIHAALQNPQMVEQIVQMIAQMPQGQQMLAELQRDIIQQHEAAKSQQMQAAKKTNDTPAPAPQAPPAGAMQ